MKALLSIMLIFALSFSYAQESNSPIEQGDFMVGAAQLSDVSFSDLQLSPSVGYALTDQIVIGFNSLGGGDGEWSGNAFGRYYLSSPFFAQASFGYDSQQEGVNVGVQGGITGFIGNHFYVEPAIGLSFEDSGTAFNLSTGFGLRF